MKKLSQLTKKEKDLAVSIVCSIASVLLILFSTITISIISKNGGINQTSSLLCIGIFFSLTVVRVSYTAREKGNLSRIKNYILIAIYTVLSLMMIFSFYSPTEFICTSAIFYYLSVVFNHVLIIVANHKRKRDVFYHVVIIVLATLLFLICLTATFEPTVQILVSTIFCMSLVFVGIKDIFVSIFERFKIGVLLRIIRKTFAAEIIFGLLILIIAFSLVFMIEEESFVTYGDALWYCFAIVTTIGFGDYTVTSVVSRILSVILGIYGIGVVALITSIIVNFYNEATHRAGSDSEEILEKLEEIVEENQKEKAKQQETKEEEEKTPE